MKKTSLIILSLFISLTVVQAEECNSYQIKTFQKEIENITYSLSYNVDKIDMNGEPLKGYFDLKISNLPANYFAAIYNGEGTLFMNEQNTLTLKGGVYEFNIYNKHCDGVIKSFEFRIPHYKYCELESDCKENTWFDGTYENTSPIYSEKPANKINEKLIIVLISLSIIVVVGFAVIYIFKRRHKL